MARKWYGGIVHEAESDELEKTWRRGICIDMADGRAVTPPEGIGELVAEVLGNFPWSSSE